MTTARRKAGGAAKAFGAIAAIAVVIIVALFLWIAHDLLRSGYPEAHDLAEDSMATAHADVLDCLKGRAEGLAGSAEARDLTRESATCFDRPEGYRGDFTLTALVSRDHTVMHVLSHSLRHGSYVIGAQVDDSHGVIAAIDVGTGASQEAPFASTATVTLAQCWTADIDLETGSLGRRERIACDEEVVALVSGNRADEGSGLAGE